VWTRLWNELRNPPTWRDNSFVFNLYTSHPKPGSIVIPHLYMCAHLHRNSIPQPGAPGVM
jgi:hypothetical protein